MCLDDCIGDEDENDDGDRESDWRATSLDVNSAGHQIKETGTDDSAGGWDRGKILRGVQFNTPCSKRT